MKHKTKLGNFTFPEGTLISHQNLIRDFVLTQYYSPDHRLPEINTEQDAYDLIKDHAPQRVRDIEFTLEILETAAA